MAGRWPSGPCGPRHRQGHFAQHPGDHRHGRRGVPDVAVSLRSTRAAATAAGRAGAHAGRCQVGVRDGQAHRMPLATLNLRDFKGFAEHHEFAAAGAAACDTLAHRGQHGRGEEPPEDSRACPAAQARERRSRRMPPLVGRRPTWRHVVTGPPCCLARDEIALASRAGSWPGTLCPALAVDRGAVVVAQFDDPPPAGRDQ
jgi:hypothetical protein